MKRIVFNKNFVIISEILIGFLFIYSGYSKIENIFDFSLTVAKYGLLPSKIITLFSLIIPFFEIIAGFFLISGFLKEGAYSVLLFLLLMFTTAVVTAYLRGLNFECGCFEIFGKEPKTGILLFIRNILLILILTNGFVFRLKKT